MYALFCCYLCTFNIAENSFKMKKYLVGVLIILAFSQGLKAQEIETNEAGSWYTLINKFKTSEKLYFSSVVQLRLVDFMQQTRIFIVAPGVNYKINKSLTGAAGYMYLNFYQEGIRISSLNYENRIYEAISYGSTLGKVKVNQRLMLEQRFFTRVNETTSYQNRIRYRINLDFNLFKLKNDKYILGKVSEEIRIRSKPGFNEPAFDQNNFGVFLGYKLLNNSKVYVGYQRNFYKIPDYWGDNLLHIMFSYNFDFTKKKFWK